MKPHPSRVLIRPTVRIAVMILQSMVDHYPMLGSNRARYLIVGYRNSTGNPTIFKSEYRFSVVNFPTNRRCPSIVRSRESYPI